MSQKLKARRKLLIEGLITIVIALTPILFYSYKYYPGDTESLRFAFIEITSNNFGDAQTALWYYLIKIVPLLLLIIWFLTSKNWWYHAILIPISMYAFQLFNQFMDENSKQVDENEILYVLGVSMVITPIVYFIRVKLVDKYVHGIDLKAMDTELKILKEKEELRKEREKLQKQKDSLAKKM